MQAFLIVSITLPLFILAFIIFANLAEIKYVIKKGGHFGSRLKILVLWVKIGIMGEKKLLIRLGPEWGRHEEPNHYQGAWSKLVGRTLGLDDWVRSESLRYMIRKERRINNNQFVELYYAYEKDGKFNTDPGLKDIEYTRLGQYFVVTISHDGWPLTPYFGGKYPAPEDMTIWIK